MVKEMQRDQLKKRILELLKRDEEFRYAVAGLVGRGGQAGERVAEAGYG